MSDDLLRYYEKELAFLRRAGGEFAEVHPKIAGRLRLNQDIVEDPHVSRLIEGVAFLNARIQQKLDDDLPELTDGLLGTLYPHYQRPIPSMFVVQFKPAPDADAVHHMERHAMLETSPFNGETCRFRTTYPVDIVPAKVETASLTGRPFIAPASNTNNGAAAVLRIQLRGITKQVKFGAVQPDNLRFFLRGQPQHVYPLYELLLNRCTRVVLARHEGDTEPVSVGPEIIQAVGFERDEGMLPYPDAAFLGYRLLTEFMIFPEKFLFIDFRKLARLIPADFGDELNLYCYLDRSDTELERSLSAATFALGCAPAINLFEHVADPIPLEQEQYDYQIVPDARRGISLEVYSVDEVASVNSNGERFEYLPFYGINHEQSRRNEGRFWLTKRRLVHDGEFKSDVASEIDITLVDLNFNPSLPAEHSLHIATLCSNRNIPARLPFGGGQPKLFLAEGGPPMAGVDCLTAPTRTLRPPLGNRARWRLISHLNLNQLSISGGPDATKALREILRLYDFRESADVRALVESITSVAAQPITAPLSIGGYTSVCRGIEVNVEFDEGLLSGSSAFLFASVLERFFSMSCSINSFTRLVARVKGKDGILKKWPPRSGDKALL